MQSTCKHTAVDRLTELCRVAILLGTVMQAATAQWSDGSMRDVDLGPGMYPSAVTDGAGGAIVAFSYGSHAQRIDAAGRLLWPDSGVSAFPFVSVSQYNDRAGIISDEAGGCIVGLSHTYALPSGSGPYDDHWSRLLLQRLNPSGELLWGARGIEICSTETSSLEFSLVDDGKNGSLLFYYESGVLRMQHVDASGALRWKRPGLSLPVVPDRYGTFSVVPDGNGGVIIAWIATSPSYASTAYVQHVDSAGSLQWPPGGKVLCRSRSTFGSFSLIRDGQGGAIAGWTTDTSGYYVDNVYAQRIDKHGNVLWDSAGVVVCMAPYDKNLEGIVLDDLGGAIIVWQDNRDFAWLGNEVVYAQRLDSLGKACWNHNGTALTPSDSVSSYYASVVSDGSGGAIITYNAYVLPGGSSVLSQRVTSDGHFLWGLNGRLISHTGGWAFSIVGNGKGGAILFWQSEDDGIDYNFHVHARGVGLATTAIVGGLGRESAGDYRLEQNWPNPWNPVTTIGYTVGGFGSQESGSRNVKLTIYNLLGQEVAVLVNEQQAPGRYTVRFDGGRLASGVYLYRLQAGNFVETKRMVLLK